MKREVTTFVIMPPREISLQVKASKERLEAHLSREFAGYVFNVTEFIPFGDDEEFCVFPIMNYVDTEGKSRMCEKPSQGLVEEIAGVCREFDFSSQRRALQ